MNKNIFNKTLYYRKKNIINENDSYIIKKNSTTFYIKGLYSINWFIPSMMHGNWEDDTFNILDYYQNKNLVYIDIGAWIGPTVLYSADKYKQIICFEPDPVAISRLSENLSVNNFTNITLITKALSDNDGISEFGGNGELGNSMSTLLVGQDNKEDFFNDYGRNGFLSYDDRKKDIISVETITIDTVLRNYNIDPSNIGLIKIDIEGGEKIVIPSIEPFLKQHKPVFYISLHRVFLDDHNINIILDILFSIYNNCYSFSSNILKEKVTKESIQERNLTSLVFER